MGGNCPEIKSALKGALANSSGLESAKLQDQIARLKGISIAPPRPSYLEDFVNLQGYVNQTLPRNQVPDRSRQSPDRLQTEAETESRRS